MKSIKKIISLSSMLLVLFLMFGTNVMADSITFDFESGMSGSTEADFGSAGTSVSQTKGGETLIVTISEGALYCDETFAFGYDAFNNVTGDFCIGDHGDYISSITLTLQSGNSFNLSSLLIGDYAGDADNITYTTSKGTVSGFVPAYVDESTATVTDLSGEDNLQGITSVVITPNDGQFAVVFDNVTIATTASATVTFTNGSSFTPNVTRGGSDQALGRFQLTGDVSGASLTDASIQLNGTRTGLSNLRLWSSTDATFESGSDTPLDGPESDGSSVSFSGFSSAIGTGGTYYFLTGDVSSGATGSVQGVIVENASLTLSGGSLTGTIANAPLSDGDASLPVSLVSFSTTTEGRSIVLTWITESETDNVGFILERSDDANTWATIASYQTHDELKGQGNTSSRTEYSFADQTVESGKSYSYRLSDVSTKGEITVHVPLSIPTDNLPETTEMENAYPNPFNPDTYITYQLAEDTEVSITVFDMLGRQVKSLFNGHQFAGSYNIFWNATDESGNKAPSGSYIIQMKTEKTRQAQKVMLMK